MGFFGFGKPKLTVTKEFLRGLDASGANSGTDEAGMGKWKIGEFVDEFGKPSGKKYISTQEIIKGTFSNTATSDSLLHVKIYVEKGGIWFRLWEYGSNLVQNSYSTPNNYSVTILCADGTKVPLKVYDDGPNMLSASDSLQLGKKGTKILLDALAKNSELSFYVAPFKQLRTSYLFKIGDTSGFVNACRKLIEG